ncbi:hypothetical protein PENANT_c115G00052 [Penicillium antarcticum]|uniref:Uncharacterized protein n=1 Tax=Penicillium antarcticum TaxID=416450 RepID=A0A1V6PI96_9EURO|nr:hypothetical protein PENANT_c115G00052 [Penicillium antarcticum]
MPSRRLKVVRKAKGYYTKY